MSDENLIANRYEIITLIGEGSVGRVFKGRDRETGNPVAIKSLKKTFIVDDMEILARFHRESRVLSELRHPHIIRLLDSDFSGAIKHLILEYVGGGTLDELIQHYVQEERSGLPILRTTELALNIAEAIMTAHQHQVIHRDIKPGNVLLTEEGVPRLSDFGLASIKDSMLTATGQIIGTPSYLSPEAIAGKPLTLQSDIWAFGVMLYYMVAGRLPFTSLDIPGLLRAIKTRNPPNIKILRPEIPDDLAFVIQTLLVKDARYRTPAMHFVVSKLKSILEKL